MPESTASAPIKAVIVRVTPFSQNCSIVWCTETRRGAVIDPGGDLDRVRAALAEQDIVIEKILLTHGHIDHAGGAAELAEELGVPIEGPQREDKFLLDHLAEQGAKYGFVGSRAVTPDRWLDEGDVVTLGAQRFAVRHCPGHTPGHVIFVHETARVAFVGDVLFQGSIGRTDLPGGDHPALIKSIVTKLWPLGEDVAIVPGHGEPSTLGQERRSNPFVGDRVLAAGD
ncbi:MAG TPA: MBL fold metallo-hydrolase [Aliidongia sp.]|nr:MBL fold metallo-hydrolase [Aliidongia sp.]